VEERSPTKKELMKTLIHARKLLLENLALKTSRKEKVGARQLKKRIS